MRTFLREPIAHFLGLGALIFALFALFDDTPPPVANDRITVTQADVDRLSAQFQATWRRTPSVQELSRLIDAFVREEVLVREALALGLDRGDAVVRQRMAQKITFLAESAAEATPVSTEALEAHLKAHAVRFERPATVEFSQILLRDEVVAADAIAVMTANGDPAAFMKPTLLHERIGASPAVVVNGTFGSGMFDRVATQEPGRWSGPVQSAFGRHIVFVHSITPGQVPPLAEIREKVELDWRASLRDELVAERIETLLAGYEVTYPDVSEAASQ